MEDTGSPWPCSTEQTQTHPEKSRVRWKQRDDCQFNEIVLHSIELPTGKENKNRSKSTRTRQTNSFRPRKISGNLHCLQAPTTHIRLEVNLF